MPPTRPDLRDIDQAVLGIIGADAILAALLPGGVHWDIAPAGLTQFVIVSQQDHTADDVFGTDDGGDDTISYLVKAVTRTGAADTALDAAARIHDLLERQPLDLAGTGYELMVLQRTRRVRYAEFDTRNVEWQHIGGVYSVMVSRGAVPAP